MPTSRTQRLLNKHGSMRRARLVEGQHFTVDVESVSGVPMEMVPLAVKQSIKAELAKGFRRRHTREIVQGLKNDESGIRGYHPRYTKVKSILSGRSYTPMSVKDYNLSSDFLNSLKGVVQVGRDTVTSSVVVGRNRRYSNKSNIGSNKKLAGILKRKHGLRKAANNVARKRSKFVVSEIKKAIARASGGSQSASPDRFF